MAPAAPLQAAAQGVAAADAQAGEDRPQGLMWNRSGLPLVFPLLVRTAPGLDYVVRLSDPASGQDVLQAYIRGGAPFRVLVPPGDFDVTFHRGADWQGDAALFGPGTETLRSAEPLHFGVRGIGTKQGRSIDLRDFAPGELAGDATAPLSLCQFTDWRQAPRRTPVTESPDAGDDYARYDLRDTDGPEAPGKLPGWRDWDPFEGLRDRPALREVICG